LTSRGRPATLYSLLSENEGESQEKGLLNMSDEIDEIEQMRRSDEEILEAIGEFCDKVWYDRHQQLKQNVEDGTETIDPGVWSKAQEEAAKIEAKYPDSELGPHSDFEWGMINGKLSALRWVMGDEWDFLDT